jgi:NAD(P)-dependent dehydrogenase (short-subunit alcohol dehydrogenase family)
MREFAGKTAFVTGGAAGIGLALGRAFAQSGMKVMLADMSRMHCWPPSKACRKSLPT